MKTAEEVLLFLNEHSCSDGPKKENGAPGPCPECLQALIAFAKERVKEAYWNCDHEGPCDTCIDKFRGQGRAEALEEAAQKIEEYSIVGRYETGHGFSENLKELFQQVRALASRPVSGSSGVAG